MQMRIIKVGGKCHFWHFIPTPLSLDCIEPQPLGQSCTTLPTTLLWWAIKVDCQDTAWPSLLSHAKRTEKLVTNPPTLQTVSRVKQHLPGLGQPRHPPRHMVITPWVWTRITMQMSMWILAILRSFQLLSNAVQELYEGLLFDLLAYVNKARKAVAQISHVQIFKKKTLDPFS